MYIHIYMVCEVNVLPFCNTVQCTCIYVPDIVL